MKTTSPNKLFFVSLLAIFSYTASQAQQGQVHISQDEKIPQLMELKTDMSAANTLGDRYKIQLYYGDNGKANEVIQKYRSLYSYPSVIVYEAPNYKVWIGKFRNRLEADRALMKIKNDFPGAFIPKPQRK